MPTFRPATGSRASNFGSSSRPRHHRLGPRPRTVLVPDLDVVVAEDRQARAARSASGSTSCRGSPGSGGDVDELVAVPPCLTQHHRQLRLPVRVRGRDRREPSSPPARTSAGSARVRAHGGRPRGPRSAVVPRAGQRRRDRGESLAPAGESQPVGRRRTHRRRALPLQAATARLPASARRGPIFGRTRSPARRRCRSRSRPRARAPPSRPAVQIPRTPPTRAGPCRSSSRGRRARRRTGARRTRRARRRRRRSDRRARRRPRTQAGDPQLATGLEGVDVGADADPRCAGHAPASGLARASTASASTRHRWGGSP